MKIEISPMNTKYTPMHLDSIKLPITELQLLNESISFAELFQIAFEAGEKIMEVYHSTIDVDYKEDSSPLTQADLQANEHICSYLKKHHPHIPIISEELDQTTYEARLKEDLVWLVDPLDGTKEFINRRDEFTVNIGLCDQGVPVMGVVHAPALKETYFAAKGQGAFKIDHETKTLYPIHVSTYSLKDPNLRLVVSISHPSQETSDFVEQFKSPNCSSFGSSLKLLKVAEGQADIYPRFAPTMEWDTCAAHAILKEAGGICVNPNTDEELTYNKPNLRNTYFVCYGQLI